jgi:N-acetylglucosamine kinase-like BadF-type ATPase
MSTDLFLGVDGGQSSTTALVADAAGRVLGIGNDGPCNHVQSAAEGRDKFIRVIGGCVRAACGGDIPRFRAACLGFSGGPADKEQILREMLHVDSLSVTTDARIALTGATAGGAGIITVAGTGSISFGRDSSGRTVRAGGWGYAFGDEGGGYDIARKALRAVLKQHEGWGPSTSLHDRMLAATAAGDANQMLHMFYTADWPRKRIATLAKLVDAEAEAGDETAIAILDQTAEALALFTNAVRHQLEDPRQVSPIGSVWRSRILTASFKRRMDGFPFVAPLLGPAAGALLEAFALANQTVTLSNLPESEK